MQSVRSAFHIGCAPWATSTMLSRRWPKPMFPSIHTPPSSGPRWCKTSRIAINLASLTCRPDLGEYAMPLIPHITYLKSPKRPYFAEFEREDGPILLYDVWLAHIHTFLHSPT